MSLLSRADYAGLWQPVILGKAAVRDPESRRQKMDFRLRGDDAESTGINARATERRRMNPAFEPRLRGVVM